MGMSGRYTIGLFQPGGAGAGLECVLESDDRLEGGSSALYWRTVMKYPGRLAMLCDRARVLARSDQPNAMPR
jgi:hypothetical protein